MAQLQIVPNETIFLRICPFGEAFVSKRDHGGEGLNDSVVDDFGPGHGLTGRGHLCLQLDGRMADGGGDGKKRKKINF